MWNRGSRGWLRKEGEDEVGKEEGLRGGKAEMEANGRKCLIMTATRKRKSRREEEQYVQPLLFVFIWTPEPWTTSRGWKQLVSAVCAIVCARTSERKKKGVCPRLHQQFKPLISPPQHPSVLHPVLFTPHLFPSISPPPGHHPTVSPGRLFTLPGWRSQHLFLSVCLQLFFYWPLVSQSVSLLWLIWLVSWLAVTQPASRSLS